MPRISRAVAIGFPHHVTQRGNYGRGVFEKEHDYLLYVENNPVRAKITNKADEYRWSSARGHMHGTVDPVLSNECPMIESVADWSAYLVEREDSRMTEAIRQNTRTGRPCGGEKFVQRLEELLGRSLNAMPRGRPQTSTH